MILCSWSGLDIVYKFFDQYLAVCVKQYKIGP